MIGTGTVLNPALGLLLATAQVPADLPEGFAAVASLRRVGLSRGRRLLLAAAFAIPVFVGATLGYFALRDAPEIVTLSVPALTGGAGHRRGRGDPRGPRGGDLTAGRHLLHRRVRHLHHDLGLRGRVISARRVHAGRRRSELVLGDGERGEVGDAELLLDAGDPVEHLLQRGVAVVGVLQVGEPLGEQIELALGGGPPQRRVDAPAGRWTAEPRRCTVPSINCPRPIAGSSSRQPPPGARQRG
jgi:hypothetical protein